MSKPKLLRGILALTLAGVVIESGQATFGKLYVVDGRSMCPTLSPDDVVHVKGSLVHRGSVAVISDGRGQSAIKRIIGLPGETVAIYRGHVYVNSRRLFEPYLDVGVYTHKDNLQNERAAIWRLNEDEYFVLGDNRAESCDSRNYGPLRRDQIRGVVTLPANSLEPSFLEITLSDSGEVVHHKHYGPNRTLAPPKASVHIAAGRI